LTDHQRFGFLECDVFRLGRLADDFRFRLVVDNRRITEVVKDIRSRSAFFSGEICFPLEYVMYHLFRFLPECSDRARDGRSIGYHIEGVPGPYFADSDHCVIERRDLPRNGCLQAGNQFRSDDDRIDGIMRVGCVSAPPLDGDLEIVRAGDQRPRLSLDDSCRILAPVVLAVHFINAFQHTVLHHGDCAAWLYFLSELEEEGNTSFQRFPALIDSFQKGEQGTCMGIVTACMHYTVHCGSVRYILLILDWEGIEVRPDGNVWMRRIAECGEQAAAADILFYGKARVFIQTFHYVFICLFFMK